MQINTRLDAGMADQSERQNLSGKLIKIDCKCCLFFPTNRWTRSCLGTDRFSAASMLDPYGIFGGMGGADPFGDPRGSYSGGAGAAGGAGLG